MAMRHSNYTISGNTLKFHVLALKSHFTIMTPIIAHSRKPTTKYQITSFTMNLKMGNSPDIL